MQILENNVIRKGQQFEVSLLWKDENPVLPESYEVACHRLKCLQKKFKKDPQLQQTMQVEIDKLLNKGYARKVTNSEFNSYSRTWYLPIFVALNPNKTGKVRLVWDAAAKSNNKVGQIAICGDIAEMFHRINVNDVHMHAQRFLWLKDGEVIAYVMKALTFGTSKNAEDFRDLYPRAVKAINFYHYMDDFIDSVQTEEEAIKLANQVKTIHAKGGFHMRNWASNSNIVRQKLAEGGAATENSFGAVEKILGEVDVRIVAAKGKVSPLKSVSIPRLELQAALIGARLSRKIIKTTRLNCTECFYWSDSKTVLKWLSMDPKNFKAFVMYRVGEILELTNLPQWNWVPSKLNPADFATKVCSAEEDMWFQGPEFLKDNEDVWPKCSDLGRISYEEVRNHLLHKSKYILYKYAQMSEFSEEIWHLKNKKPIEKDSILKQLNICLDENYVIRAYGRAEMLNCNNAIILPTNHYITFLVVKYYHENYNHCLHEATISRIKSNFYIPKLRVVYKKVRSSCQHCKNLYAVPRPPQMATLPSARLSSFERPFTYVGIDFFGPLLVTVGRHREKRWRVLFTCLTVRAIHIEVAHSLDTSSCILCIQNFISRRGSPKEIYTDNGTNFKAVEKILREEKQHIDLHQVFSKYDDIKWRFNPPAAPHMGGAWERLIRTKGIVTELYTAKDGQVRSVKVKTTSSTYERPVTKIAILDVGKRSESKLLGP
ncbi:uncharacterized protein LOC142228371 [Haematobia irritans]|uniref:uncharacterized protein LOC142228371 n=1 Tax=Haematobia irritans TaxID=7368 RepID=UPI003F507649